MQDKKIHLAMMSGLVALSFSPFALADMSMPDGWYVEGNIGSSHISNVHYHGSSNNSGIGGNIDVGYKFMPYFAGEIGYTQYAGSNVKHNGSKAATVKNYSYDLALKGILPVSNSGAELFAKLGAERVNAHYSIVNSATANAIGISGSQHSANGLYIGVGGQYYFMPEMAVTVQWALANGNNTTGNMSLFSVGINYIVG